MIPADAVEAATLKLASLNSDAGDQLTDAEWARAILEAAAPYMMADEAKLAAVIVALDPFERVTKWMATDDEAGRCALEAVQKIRAILDGAL